MVDNKMYDHSTDEMCKCCGNKVVFIYGKEKRKFCVKCGLTLPKWMVVKK